jgi:hypothetical protein
MAGSLDLEREIRSSVAGGPNRRQVDRRVLLDRTPRTTNIAVSLTATPAMTPDRLTPDALERRSARELERMSLEDDREQIVQVLSVHFASGNLEMDELEDRLAAVYRAQSRPELERLVSDLPALPLSVDPGGSPQLAPSSSVPPRGVLVAIMGGGSRRGNWMVPRHLKIYTVMGGMELDMREATFAPGVTEIEIFAMMGGVDILVPPGVRVEVMGAGIMGGFDVSAGDASTYSDEGPVLRLSGVAIMGGVGASRKEPSKKVLSKFSKALKVAKRFGLRDDY